MQLRYLSSMLCAVCMLCAGAASGQKLERTTMPQAGDKQSFKWVLNNKAQPMDIEWAGESGGSVRGTQKVGGKDLAVELDTAGDLTRALCISNGQQCGFAPGIKVADFPLEKGKKWTTSFAVTGETFTAQVTQERKVDKIEKIKVPAGEFEAAKISFSGRIRGADSKGTAFTGREDGIDWVAVVNGKSVLVKTEYRNSFGEKANVEMMSSSQ